MHPLCGHAQHLVLPAFSDHRHAFPAADQADPLTADPAAFTLNQHVNLAVAPARVIPRQTHHAQVAVVHSGLLADVAVARAA